MVEVEVSCEKTGSELNAYTVTWAIIGSREERIAREKKIYETLETEGYKKLSSWEESGVSYIRHISEHKISLADDLSDVRRMRRLDLESIASSDLGFRGRQASLELKKRLIEDAGGHFLANNPGGFTP